MLIENGILKAYDGDMKNVVIPEGVRVIAGNVEDSDRGKNAAEGIKQQESHDKEIRICVTGLLDQRILADITKAIEETYTSQDSVLLDLRGTTGLPDFTISGVGKQLYSTRRGNKNLQVCIYIQQQ